MCVTDLILRSVCADAYAKQSSWSFCAWAQFGMGLKYKHRLSLFPFLVVLGYMIITKNKKTTTTKKKKKKKKKHVNIEVLIIIGNLII